MSAGRTAEGAGCVTWWGFSPARDLLRTGPVRQEGAVNALLVGSGDPRHILKTIASLRDTDSLHIWVIEDSMEVVARQLLLLYLALMPQESMGIHEKTEVFLEVFGNSEVRVQTEETLRHAASQLSLSVTDALETNTHPCLDTTPLKYKERDELDRIFRLWVQPPSSSSAPGRAAPSSITKAWDDRVRRHLGTRYDSRQGCFDWDLSMKLHQKGCGVINKQQYVRWREQGVAFEMREGIYQTINASLLSTRVFSQRGGKVAARGYWGDIVSSPYLSFGIETDDKSLLQTHNGLHVKTAVDISIANVQALFRALSCRRDSLTDTEITEAGEAPSRSDAQHKSINMNDLMRLKGVSVTFLPMDSLSKLPEKQKYCQLFNTIYFAASLVHQLGPTLTQIAAPNAVLVVELAKYLLDLTKEQEAGFADKASDIAKKAGFEPRQEVETGDDAHITFTLESESEACQKLTELSSPLPPSVCLPESSPSSGRTELSSPLPPSVSLPESSPSSGRTELSSPLPPSVSLPESSPSSGRTELSSPLPPSVSLPESSPSSGRTELSSPLPPSVSLPESSPSSGRTEPETFLNVIDTISLTECQADI